MLVVSVVQRWRSVLFMQLVLSRCRTSCAFIQLLSKCINKLSDNLISGLSTQFLWTNIDFMGWYDSLAIQYDCNSGIIPRNFIGCTPSVPLPETAHRYSNWHLFCLMIPIRHIINHNATRKPCCAGPEPRRTVSCVLCCCCCCIGSRDIAICCRMFQGRATTGRQAGRHTYRIMNNSCRKQTILPLLTY